MFEINVSVKILSEFGRYYFVICYTQEDRGETGMQIRDAMEIARNKSGLSYFIFSYPCE